MFRVDHWWRGNLRNGSLFFSTCLSNAGQSWNLGQWLVLIPQLFTVKLMKHWICVSCLNSGFFLPSGVFQIKGIHTGQTLERGISQQTIVDHIWCMSNWENVENVEVDCVLLHLLHGKWYVLLCLTLKWLTQFLSLVALVWRRTMWYF